MAAKRLRASMGLRNIKDDEQPSRFRKRKLYPTIKKINKHMTRKYGFLFCLSKKRDILSRFQYGDILECLEDDLTSKLRAQQTALHNWATIGFRIRMIQAFKMMSSLSEQVGPEEELVCFNGYVIAKNSRIKLYWDVINNIFMLISYFLVPYQIAFGGPSTSEMHQLELILDTVVFLDVIFNFITDNQSDPGEIVTNKKIAYRYISSYFLFDVLSFLPGLVTFEL